MAEAEAPSSIGFDQVGQFLQGLTLRQRILLGVGAALVAGTLWAFVSLIGNPKYVTLYSGLKTGDAQALSSRLAARQIDYQLSPDGSSLSVPADKLDAARLETASQGLPRNARLGFELFDSPNWAGSDFTEKVNYQRALEGELERTLQTLGEVEAVRVHLVLPRESLFTEEERSAKAAVILKTRGGGLSEQEQQAIPQLVASAVDGLRPENVTVVDADSNTPLLRRRVPGGAGASYDLDDELGKTLVRTLEPVVGDGHVRASVHVEYDLSTSDNTEELYDPKAAATVSLQKSEETMGGAGPAGVPGTASNTPGGAGATVQATLQQEQQSSRSENSTYAVSKSVRHTVEPAGRVKRVAAAVLVDDAVEYAEKEGKQIATRRKRTPDEMKEIERLAQAAIGFDDKRGDLLALENMSFQTGPAEALSKPSPLDRGQRLLRQWAWMLRYAGIALLFLVVYLLILRPVKKQLLTSLRELPGRLAQSAKDLSKAGGAALAATLEAQLPEGTEEAKRATLLKRQLTDKVKAEPAAASRLVQTWIRENKVKS
jgi:flagellar M-ring protein FliF